MANVDSSVLTAAKLAGRITTDAYDEQIVGLLNAALMDLGVAGVNIPEQWDSLVRQAAITYFLLHFGAPEEYDRLKRSYDEQKAQLATCTGYTTWTEAM